MVINGRGKQLTVVLAFFAMLFASLAGCVLPEGGAGSANLASPAPYNENERTSNVLLDERHPTPEKNVLYLHGGTVDKGSSRPQTVLWMNPLLDDPAATEDTAYSVWFGGAGMSVTHRKVNVSFPLNAPLSKNLVMQEGGEAVARIRVEVIQTHASYSLWTAFWVDGAEYSSNKVDYEVASTDSSHEFRMSVPAQIDSGSNVSFSIYVQGVSDITELEADVIYVNVYVDGSSSITLPIAALSDKVESPSPEDDGTDDDSDESGENEDDDEDSGDGDNETSKSKGERGASIEESGTTVQQDQNGRWIAYKTVTISNDFGGAASCSLSLDTVNGNLVAEAWDNKGYAVGIILQGMGNTREAAMSNLNDLYYTHQDFVSGKTLSLSTCVDDQSDNWNDKSASIYANVPKTAEYSLYLDTVNGNLAARQLTGTYLEADTCNGNIESRSTFDDLDLDTTNGNIEVETTPRASGKYVLDTTNGNIRLSLGTTNDHGYDVYADVTNGRIQIDLPDTEPVGSQEPESQHVRTKGYDSKKIKVSLSLDTTNGNINAEEN